MSRDHVHASLTAEPAAAHGGRTVVVDALDRWDLAHLSDDAALVSSELIANAVSHGEGTVDLHVVREPAGIRIEVTDHGAGRPRIRPRATPEAGGLGLVVVSKVAADWGVDPADEGKTVWAVIEA